MAKGVRNREKEAGLSHSLLLSLLHYDPETGIFLWKVRNGPFTGPGVVAGSVSRQGYRSIRVNYGRWGAHRLAWFYAYGEWPEGEIDHINRKKDDNRLCNLRAVSHSQNMWNTERPRKNSTGTKNVHCIHRKDRRTFYRVRIIRDGVAFFAQDFKSLEEAIASRNWAVASFSSNERKQLGVLK